MQLGEGDSRGFRIVLALIHFRSRPW